jgi:predicted aspartyl protease
MRRTSGRPSVLAVAVLAVVLTACEVTTPGRVEVPADPERGEIGFSFVGPNDAALVVSVHINGEGPFDFVLDTGATLTCVTPAIAERLALPERRAVGFGAGIGGSGRVTIVGLDTLRIGAVRLFDLPACVVDLGRIEALGLGVDGLIGLNALKPFRMTLDFERRLLRLEEP